MVAAAVLERPKVEMPQDHQKEIASRIEDWQQRISDLYAHIAECAEKHSELWLSENMTAKLFEKPMHDAGLEPVMLPVLNVGRGKGLIVSFQPIGLWVLGANGRMDILTHNGAYELIDEAEVGQPPNWQVFAPGSWEAKPFDHEVVERLLS
ncbi:hypothetical protein SAMN04488518_107126 [Pseudovibrio ascidiaceicola]|uniref:DUF3806 domain-containing protein n=1 Tax=Pseudovibrio ascidiaceicola TaxID=285279 RepID=A0A1I4B405_9HYPH|nr:hypothetical protein [Pseudovibrio ascidiaceicola]SFK63588.1 hypothetical protein SAMN04488518_107126 [Pseudovibrio ascidiaceicola]